LTCTTWNQRYENSELVWPAAPNIWVKQLTEDLQAGSALDIAAGEGRNALWLAARGWHVTAVDFSTVALQRARSLAEEHLGRDAIRLETIDADVVTWVARERSYDLVLVAYLHLPKQQRRSVMRAAAQAVAPGGTLLVVGHDLENLTAGHGGPRDPALLYRPGDIVLDIELEHLVVAREETVPRSVADGRDQPVEALDALVVARRPLG
jgi:SAM-dependent methyltransferase